MLYHFTWNSHFLIQNHLKAWKEKFIEKNGDFNFLHIKNLLDHDKNFLIENLTATSFFSEKKFILIDIDLDTKDTKNTDLLEFIINNAKNIPNDNIVVLHSLKPDKRSKIYKEINKISELKEFNTQSEADIESIILNKYNWKIDRSAVWLLVRYKWWDILKSISEIEKLLITYENITTEVIKKNITPELEESIFLFIDDLLQKNISNALSKLDIILNDTNVYAFYNNLLANLRTNFYIFQWKKHWLSTQEITTQLKLWNRWFLVTKKLQVSEDIFTKFYLQLISIDKKMKSWKLTGTDDNDFLLELHKAILLLK